MRRLERPLVCSFTNVPCGSPRDPAQQFAQHNRAATAEDDHRPSLPRQSVYELVKLRGHIHICCEFRANRATTDPDFRARSALLSSFFLSNKSAGLNLPITKGHSLRMLRRVARVLNAQVRATFEAREKASTRRVADQPERYRAKRFRQY